MVTRNLHSNTKYVLMQMFGDNTKSSHYRPLCDAKSFRAICKVFDMEPELDVWTAKQAEHGFPTDLDYIPRRTQNAAQGSDKKKPASVGDLPLETPAKRKIEQVVENENTNDVKGDEESAPKPVKQAKISSDGSSSQPTPADTPKPDAENDKLESAETAVGESS